MDPLELCRFQHRSGIDLISRKRCLHCIASRKRRIKRTIKIGRKAPPRGGNGKLPGGIPLLRHHHDDGPDTDQPGKPVKISESSIYLWYDSHNEFGAKLQ